MSQTGNTYEPWLTDDKFLSDLLLTNAYSLVDTQRLWELWQLVHQAVPGTIVEIGVCNGGSLALMGLAARHRGARVLGFDTFNGCVLAGPKDSHYIGGEHKADRSVVDILLKTLGLESSVTVVEGEFPASAVDIDLGPIALAHIDVDIYQSSKNCAEFILPRLVVGGVIVFDDYGYELCDGVTKYVNELWPRDDLIFVHNLNGHGLIIKTKPMPSPVLDPGIQ